MVFDKNDGQAEKAVTNPIALSSISDGDYSIYDALKAITNAAANLKNYKLPDLGINFDDGIGLKMATGEKSTIYMAPEEKFPFSDSTGSELLRRRAALVQDLPPDQKVTYDREESAYRAWALGTGMSEPPRLPVHEAIERKTNPGGRSDRELMPNWQGQGAIDLKTGLLM